MIDKKPAEYKSITPLGEQEPQTDLLSQAKFDSIRAMQAVEWGNARKWQAFAMKPAFTEWYKDKGLNTVHHAMQALTKRIYGHYVRTGKRPKVRWQLAGDDVPTLFLLLEP